MSKDDVSRLFVPFQQADNSATREHGGTGLGLVISRRLARLLDGEVSVKSTEMGRGTTFRLDLPCDVPPAPVRSGCEAYSKTLSGLRTLLVDDSEDNRAVIGAMLKRLGARVSVAVNGEHAIAAAMDTEFDIILMDLHMPVMDGIEATRVLRAGGYDGLVVCVTGCVMDEDVKRCLAAGCDMHLPKPVTSKSLMAAIASSCLQPAT